MSHELEVVEGLRIDRGYISPYFVTNSKSQKCELEEPYVLLYDKKLSNVKGILPVLEFVVQSRSSLIIIAEDVDSEALATMIVNKLRLGLNICAVKAPGFGEHRKAQMHDIATLVGGQVISEETGMKLEEVRESCATSFGMLLTWNVFLSITVCLSKQMEVSQVLGRTKSITISKDDTIIMGGHGDRDSIEERAASIRNAIDATKSEYEKEKLQERLAKLTGGVAVIKVRQIITSRCTSIRPCTLLLK